MKTKPSSGLPDLVVAPTGATPTAHLVWTEPGGGTDHIAPPRVFPRKLPPATAMELARRGNEIAIVIAKRFAPLAMRQVRQVRSGALPIDMFAAPLRQTFEDLGGTFMKFGQLVASSPGVFGEEVSDEFRACLDTGPAVDFQLIRNRIEADLGMALEDAYAQIDTEPVGRASIAVVHRAQLHDGRVVGVKILRPEIHHVVSTDLDMLQPLLELIADQTGDENAGWFLQMLDGFREQIGEELDLRNEARAMMHFKTLLGDGGLPGARRSGGRSRAVEPQRPHDGVLGGRTDRRPGGGREVRGGPGPSRRTGGACLLPDDDQVGRLPRRRARGQPPIASRRSHRSARLGHRRAARRRHPQVLRASDRRRPR